MVDQCPLGTYRGGRHTSAFRRVVGVDKFKIIDLHRADMFLTSAFRGLGRSSVFNSANRVVENTKVGRPHATNVSNLFLPTKNYLAPNIEATVVNEARALLTDDTFTHSLESNVSTIERTGKEHDDNPVF